jgi:putative endonuclease
MADGAARRRGAYRRGHYGEWLAALALVAKGYRILAFRYRTKSGEIDLIARRGTLVAIVEVKARKSLSEAINAVSATAERRIEAAADLWLARQRDYHLGRISIGRPPWGCVVNFCTGQGCVSSVTSNR